MPPAAPIVGTDRFELHSNIRVNLHHFLLAWADADAWPPYALPVAERGYWRILLNDDSASADADARRSALQAVAKEVLAAESGANSTRSSSTSERRLPVTPR